MSEGGISRERETLQVFYGLHQPGGVETKRQRKIKNIREDSKTEGKRQMWRCQQASAEATCCE